MKMMRDDIANDIAAVRRDVGNLVEHLKAGASEAAQTAAAQLDEGARKACNTLASEAGRPVKAFGRQVEAQPLMSVLIAAGVGYIGGRLLSR
jgi:ElaB/YqjD/DUF883 family membrane-anchored ribosome-binding protein